MTNALHTFHLLVIAIAGWLNRQQQMVIDYLVHGKLLLKLLREADIALGSESANGGYTTCFAVWDYLCSVKFQEAFCT